MYRLCTVLCILSGMLLLASCNTRERNEAQLVKYWQGKKIIYPDEAIYTVYGEDTIKTAEKTQFQILVFADSVGCMSCKLKLELWKSFIEELNIDYNVSILFVFQTKKSEEMSYILKRANFNYPVVFDEEGSFNTLNDFPTDDNFRTFLLDKEGKVILVGNPIYNSKIKNIYMSIIWGEYDNKELGYDNKGENLQTKVDLDKTFASLGVFSWREEQKTVFQIKNTGKQFLTIDDVRTSCGCTSVSFSQKPVQPGESINLDVTYKAEHPGHFNKTITVYCNAKVSPLPLKIMGNAE